MTGSEKAAAHQLGLSHATVKHHLANAVQGGRGDDGAAGVDPGAAAAQAWLTDTLARELLAGDAPCD